MQIIIVNGANLNLLKFRDQQIYGNEDFDSFFENLKSTCDTIDLTYFQSNHEGVLIDFLQKNGFKADGIILNPGGFTHTSVALRDTVELIPVNVVEVHISNIYEREEFRKISYFTDVCVHSVVGKGIRGYKIALDYLINIAQK